MCSERWRRSTAFALIDQTASKHEHGHVIDLYCHPLPGLDDGPASLETSLVLLHCAARAATNTIVATPHVCEAYPVQATAWSMLEQGLVHVVASDGHDASRRPPLLREPLVAAGIGVELIATLCEDSAAAILAGESPVPAPAVTSPRSRRLRRLRRR